MLFVWSPLHHKVFNCYSSISSSIKHNNISDHKTTADLRRHATAHIEIIPTIATVIFLFICYKQFTIHKYEWIK